MSILLRQMLSPYMGPVGDADGGGGSADRGDDFVATGDAGADAAADAAAAEAAAAEALAAEIAAKGKGGKDADADVDADADADADDAKKGGKKDSRIPLGRHKDILERERAARREVEEKLAKYEKGGQVAAVNADLTKLENTVLQLEAAHTKALADGDGKLATQLARDIRQTERQINDAANDMKMQSAIAVATEQARYDVALERVEESYPAINPDHDDFDKEQLGKVVEMKVFYEKMRGMTPTKALQQAVIQVLGQKTAAQEKATEVAPRVTAEEVAAARKKAGVEKTLAATSKTPASTGKIGLDSDKAGGSLTASSVMKMSQDDFKKLPDDVLSKMRGDDL